MLPFVRTMNLLGGEIHCRTESYELRVVWHGGTDTWTMQERFYMVRTSECATLDNEARMQRLLLAAEGWRQEAMQQQLEFLREAWRSWQAQEDTRSRAAIKELVAKRSPPKSPYQRSTTRSTVKKIQVV
jgi:hypothetical protein